MEAHYATVWEAAADTIPDEDAIVQGTRRLRWGEFEGRAARLAGVFAEAGVTRGSKVALYLYNTAEYMEAYFAAFKLRAIPVNVNYRYLDDELHYLIENSDSDVVVFHSSLGDRVGRVRTRLPHVKRWIEVDDGGAPLAGAERYEDVLAASTAAARIERSPSDIGMTYTGGTTGMPKGVMSEVGGGVLVQLATLPPLLGAQPKKPDDVPTLARELVEQGRRASTIVACPLMHGTGIGIGANPTLTCAGVVHLLEQRKFDPHEVWDIVEREGARGVVVVGDPFARPLVRALDDRPGRDLSSLVLVSSAGAMFSREVKERLVAHIPQLLIIDFMAATEGAMGQSVFTKNSRPETARFRLNPAVKVFTDDGREVAAGTGEVGMVAVPNTGTLGYYKDEEKTAKTFREIAGVRWTFPGDYATVEADGSITLLGRGSQVINTGGEKVFAEEVEEVLKTHPGIDDCLVVGVPDEQFGSRIVAVVSPIDGADVNASAVIGHAKDRLAAYKAPKEVIVVDVVPRAPNGKADYKRARELAATR